MDEEKKYNSYYNFCDEFESKEAELKYYENNFKEEFLNTIIKYIIDEYINQIFSSLSSFFYFKNYNDFYCIKIHTCWNIYKTNNQNIAFSFENINTYSEYTDPIIIETMPKFYECILSVLKIYANRLNIGNKNENIICDVNNGVSIEFDTTIGNLIEIIRTEIVNELDYKIAINKKIKNNYDEWLENVYIKIFHKGFLDQFWKKLMNIYYSEDRNGNPSVIIKKSDDEEPLFNLQETKSGYYKTGKYHYSFVIKISSKYYEYVRDYIKNFIKEYFNYNESNDFDERMYQLFSGLDIEIEKFGDNWTEFNLDDIDRMQEMYSLEKKKLAEINETFPNKSPILTLNLYKKQS